MAVNLALLNQKGGVGKTTTTVNLGAALAEKGKRVLLIDIDAQCNLTSSFGYNEEEEDIPNIYGAIKGEYPLPILHRKDNLDIVIGTIDLAAADLELGGEAGRDFLLKECLSPYQDKYDYILIDCPPALNVITLNVLTVANGVIIPLQAEYLALKGMKMLFKTINKVKARTNPNLNILGILITKYDIRRSLCKKVEETVKRQFGDLVFKTIIRVNSPLSEAPVSGEDIFEYSPKSNGARDYSSLASEIIK